MKISAFFKITTLGQSGHQQLGQSGQASSLNVMCAAAWLGNLDIFEWYSYQGKSLTNVYNLIDVKLYWIAE